MPEGTPLQEEESAFSLTSVGGSMAVPACKLLHSLPNFSFAKLPGEGKRAKGEC